MSGIDNRQGAVASCPVSEFFATTLILYGPPVGIGDNSQLQLPTASDLVLHTLPNSVLIVTSIFGSVVPAIIGVVSFVVAS